MNITIKPENKRKINPKRIGLFFEDINYAADGGLYAQMIENFNFESIDCYGDKADYYTTYDGGYAWKLYGDKKYAKMQYVMGSPVATENPHYLRFTADQKGSSFSNQAYDGIFMEANESYRISLYARSVLYHGSITVSIRKNNEVIAQKEIELLDGVAKEEKNWKKYEFHITAPKLVEGADFVITLNEIGCVEFDFISMLPQNAVCGVFRKDLFEALKDLKPGFMRFPGGCIVEGNTLDNRYRFKDTLHPIEHRKFNWNRWAVHFNKEENDYHNQFSHYGQTMGLGYYEYFLLCEALECDPLPVLSVGLACQFQSFEKVACDTKEFEEFIQDALNLIEFANGDETTYWGNVRKEMGHTKTFGLKMIGIGNEQWETKEAGFFERYYAFEARIHEVCPDIKLIGSAGPDVSSKNYQAAWDFYRTKQKEVADNFVFAVDEHYYVPPKWLYENVGFYDAYPRDVKVFAGEYAAHIEGVEDIEHKNTLEAALAEAAFLTGLDRNADVVELASYAPLFARIGYTQWGPDMIWFNGDKSYLTPSYYVQYLFSHFAGDTFIDSNLLTKKILDTDEKEADIQKEFLDSKQEDTKPGLYHSLVMDSEKKELYCKIVNATAQDVDGLTIDCGKLILNPKTMWILTSEHKTDENTLDNPSVVALKEVSFVGENIKIPKNSVLVLVYSCS